MTCRYLSWYMINSLIFLSPTLWSNFHELYHQSRTNFSIHLERINNAANHQLSDDTRVVNYRNIEIIYMCILWIPVTRLVYMCNMSNWRTRNTIWYKFRSWWMIEFVTYEWVLSHARHVELTYKKYYMIWVSFVIDDRVRDIWMSLVTCATCRIDVQEILYDMSFVRDRW